MAQDIETTQKQVQGQFSTAEVTHVLEALQLEGQCYVKNHLFMQMSDEASQAVREWHDNVTRRNLDELRNVAKEMGLDLPFPMKLEDRENELKEKVKGGQIANVLTPGEILMDVKTTAVHLDNAYTVSMNLATHDRIREVFRGSREVVAENLPRVIQALKGTDQYYPPPVAHEIGYVAPKGVSPETGQTVGSKG